MFRCGTSCQSDLTSRNGSVHVCINIIYITQLVDITIIGPVAYG